jgi:hypothetical protein
MSEKVKIKIARNVVHLPAIALRGLVVFPNNVVHFEVHQVHCRHRGRHARQQQRLSRRPARDG